MKTTVPTKRTTTFMRQWLCVSVVTLGLVLVPGQPAEACGGFFAKRGTARPSLALERVLITHDRATGQQHFIRQVSFRAGSERFGFVVPTPSRPKVAAVEKPPFDQLDASYPFHRPPRAFGRGGGRLGSGSAPGKGVQVLEVSKVGSFTAFVLTATDDKALAKWLKDNELVATPRANAWLSHYVASQFFFVAMRYDPPATAPQEADAKVTAETIRISFQTPLPFYPYLEPENAEPNPAAERAIELWLLTRHAAIPVSLLRQDEGARWVRPFRGGSAYQVTKAQLERMLGTKLSHQ